MTGSGSARQRREAETSAAIAARAKEIVDGSGPLPASTVARLREVFAGVEVPLVPVERREAS